MVEAAKTDPQGSDVANRAGKAHFQDILDNLPISLRGVTPSLFPFPGRPIAERRLPLADAIGPTGLSFYIRILFTITLLTQQLTLQVALVLGVRAVTFLVMTIE